MAAPIQVKLVRSPIGRPEKHRRILQGLGLKYVNKVVTLYSTPQFLVRSGRFSIWLRSVNK